MLMLAVLAGLIFAFFFVRPSELPLSNETLACIGKLYSPYDPKNLQQCVAVCMACSSGVKTTCSTSCSLKGAR